MRERERERERTLVCTYTCNECSELFRTGGELLPREQRIPVNVFEGGSKK